MMKKLIYLLLVTLLVFLLAVGVLLSKKLVLYLQNNIIFSDAPLTLGRAAIHRPNNWLLLFAREKPGAQASYYGFLPAGLFGVTLPVSDVAFLSFVVVDAGNESSSIFFQEMSTEQEHKAKFLLNSCMLNKGQPDCLLMHIGQWVAIERRSLGSSDSRFILVPDLAITVTIVEADVKHLKDIHLETR